MSAGAARGGEDEVLEPTQWGPKPQGMGWEVAACTAGEQGPERGPSALLLPELWYLQSLPSSGYSLQGPRVHAS